jgi:hypothetical protein
MYMAGSLTAAVRVLARYKLYLASVHEVRWEKGDIVRTGDHNFFSMEKKTKIINWEQEFLCTTDYFTAAGVVPIESGVLPQFYWIPVSLLAPLC